MDFINQFIEKYGAIVKTYENKNKSILIIDDNKSIIDALQSVLKEDGYELICTSNPELGVEYFNGQIDLIILDLKMPKMDGFKVMTTIRKKNKSVPIILYSALIADEVVDYVDNIICFYIEKGSSNNVNELFSLINKMLRWNN